MIFSYSELLQYARNHREALLSSHETQLDFTLKIIDSIKFFHQTKDEIERLCDISIMGISEGLKQCISVIKLSNEKLKLHLLNESEWDQLFESLQQLTVLSYGAPSQYWFEKKMHAAGYILFLGECHGIVNMAMQSFFLKDMNTFNERLKCIYMLPMSYFDDDFSDARKQIAELIQINHMEEAQVKQDELTNIRSFFDGVALYSFSRPYKEWFGIEEAQNIALQMPPENSMPLILPDSLILDTNQTPRYMTSFFGAYSKDELTLYFQTLQENLEACSFSLQIKAAEHVIGVFYDHEKKHWYHVQPGNLPAEVVSNCETLSDLVRNDFSVRFSSDTAPFCITTNLYVQEKDNALTQDAMTRLEEDSTWKQLHNFDIFDLSYLKLVEEQGGFTPLTDALTHRRTQWIDEQLSHLDANIIISKILFPLKILPITIGSHLYRGEAPYDKAIIKEVKRLCYRHLPLLKQAEYACETGDSITLAQLIEQGVEPTVDMLEEALINDEHQNIVAVLMQHVKPNIYCLMTAYRPRETNVLLLSMLHDFNPPPEDLLIAAVRNNDIDMVDKLLAMGTRPSDMIVKHLIGKDPELIKKIINQGVKPTFSLVASIYSKGNTELAREMIKSGISTHSFELSFGNGEKKKEMMRDFLEYGLPASPGFLSEACYNNDAELVAILLREPFDIPEVTLNKIFSRYGINASVLNQFIEKNTIPQPTILFQALSARTDHLTGAIDNNYMSELVHHLPLVAHEVFLLACQSNDDPVSTERNSIIIDEMLNAGLRLTRVQCDAIQNEDIRKHVIEKVGDLANSSTKRAELFHEIKSKVKSLRDPDHDLKPPSLT